MEKHAAASVLSRSRWSHLMEELLDNILQRIPLSDWPNFGSVCKSWRSAMLTHPVTPLLVHLKAPPLQDIAGPNAELIAFRLCNDNIQQFFSMKLPLCMVFSRIRCFGSGNGWLAVRTYCNKSISRFTESYLVNPMSGDWIGLPPIIGPMFMSALSSPPTSGDCRVAACGKFRNGDDKVMNFASCKLGDHEWDLFDTFPACWTMTFHKDRLYVRSTSKSLTRIYVFDLHVKMIGTIDPVSDYLTKTRLVDAGDELLLVARHYFHGSFRVYKLKGGNGEELPA